MTITVRERNPKIRPYKIIFKPQKKNVKYFKLNLKMTQVLVNVIIVLQNDIRYAIIGVHYVYHTQNSGIDINKHGAKTKY